MLSVEILTIGREILDGRIIDSNSAALGKKLKALGLEVRYAQRVDDDIPRIVESFEIAEKRADIVLVTGGLGPTQDDLTAEAFANYLGEKLEYNAEALRQVEAIFTLLNRPFNDSQKKQALLAPSCSPLRNKKGTAPGFQYISDKMKWFFMPGVPSEMHDIFDREIAPQIENKNFTHKSYTWLTQFTSEGDLAEVFKSLINELPPYIDFGYRTKFPENHLAIHANCTSDDQITRFDEEVTKITKLIGHHCYHYFDTVTDKEKGLETIVVELASKLKTQIATAESCTGGLIAHRLTNVPGSSDVVWGGRVVYHNQAKLDLGVEEKVLKEFGAVSEETAIQLAQKTLDLFPAEHSQKIAIATTGIAGPTGGSDKKPVGLCCIGIASHRTPARAITIQGHPAWGRDKLKLFFSQKALELVRQELLEA